MKILVVAGNYAEFRNWQYNEGTHAPTKDREAAQYIMSVSDLRFFEQGSDVCVLFIGRYFSRGDIKVLREEIAHRRFRNCE